MESSRAPIKRLTVHQHHHLLPALILGLLLVWAVVALIVYKPWRKRRLPVWEERWRELSRKDRERIEAAARRGDPASDPDEAFLITGSALVQRPLWRSRRTIDLVILALGLFFLVGSAIVVNPITILISFALLATFFVRFRRRRAVIAGINQTVESRRLETGA